MESAKLCTSAIRIRMESNYIGTGRKNSGRTIPTASSKCTPNLWILPDFLQRGRTQKDPVPKQIQALVLRTFNSEPVLV